MCVICYKPAGIPVDMGVLKKCWDSNSNGAGLMFSENNKLVIAKGFMKWRTVKRYIKRRGMNTLKELPVAFHFRIATHGSVAEKNTHPFKINDNLAMMHNGVISSVDRYIGKDDDVSDSEMFAKRFIQDAFSDIPIFALEEGQPINELIAKYIGTSKLFFMNNSGDIAIVNEKLGTWKSFGEGIGMWFSNTHWMPSVYAGSKWSHVPKVWKPKENTGFGFGTYLKGAESIPSNGHKFIEATKPQDEDSYMADEDMYCFTCATSFKESDLMDDGQSLGCCPTCGSTDTEYVDDIGNSDADMDGWTKSWWDVDYKCWDCEQTFDALDTETGWASVSGTEERLWCPFCRGVRTYRIDDQQFVDRFGVDFFDTPLLMRGG